MFKVSLEKEHISAKNTYFSCQKNPQVCFVSIRCHVSGCRLSVEVVSNGGSRTSRPLLCSRKDDVTANIFTWSVRLAESSACRTGIEHIAAAFVPLRTHFRFCQVPQTSPDFPEEISCELSIHPSFFYHFSGVWWQQSLPPTLQLWSLHRSFNVAPPAVLTPALLSIIQYLFCFHTHTIQCDQRQILTGQSNQAPIILITVDIIRCVCVCVLAVNW